MSVIAAADVAIVGCGVIGLATAERLAAAGLSVVLVDETGVANGPTGASGGLVRGLDLADEDRGWALEGLDVYLRRGPHGTCLIRTDPQRLTMPPAPAHAVGDSSHRRSAPVRYRGHAGRSVTRRPPGWPG